MSFIKKFFKGCLQLLMISCITLLLFEAAYRYGIIDFYKAEIEALNPQANIERDTVDYLIFGDSFSTPINNYVDKLRKKYPETSFLNLSISGTGIKQVNTFAKKKIKRYKPKHIIYQVYIGNDLLDVHHLSNWSDLSLARSVYWKTTDYMWSGVYINQKLRVFSANQVNIQKLEKDLFSIPKYTKRQRMLFRADAQYLDKTITLRDDFVHRYDSWKEEIQSFLDVIPSDVKVSIVFIPHCAQIGDSYYNNMISLGAQFDTKNELQNKEYAFYTKASTDFEIFDNVSFYNPIQYLKQKDTLTYRLYYANDPHFNDRGQTALYEFLDQTIFDR